MDGNVPVWTPPIPFGQVVWYQVMLLLYLFSYCWRYHPDILYSRHSLFSFTPPVIAKILRIPLIVEMNGLIMDEIHVAKNSHFEMIVAKWSETINCTAAWRIVAVTHSIKTTLEGRYQRDDILVIPNGANTALFRPMDMEISRTYLSLDTHARYVCFVGNLAAWQGVEYIVRAAPDVLRVHPDIRFLIVGDGTLKNELIELTRQYHVSGAFIFTGSVVYDNVPLYINASEICLVPKKPIQSGYSPLKLYEYMACSKPVIATRTDGFEILENVQAGILINPENSGEIQNAICTLIENSSLREQMGARGRAYVEKNHSWSRVAQKVYRVCSGTKP